MKRGDIMIDLIKKKMPILIPIIVYFSCSWWIVQLTEILIEKYNVPQWFFHAVVIFIIIGFLVVIVIIIIVYFSSKSLYINEQIKNIKSARKNIMISIHSLNSVEKDKKYGLFNESLKNARENNIDIKILAPGGIERAKGAFEICKQFKINVRFANQLEDQDLRFTIIDENVAIISYQSISVKKLSKKYVILKSQRLCQLLMRYFNEIWDDEKTMDFNGYIRGLLCDLNVTNDQSSLQRFSDRTGIPKSDLKDIMALQQK